MKILKRFIPEIISSLLLIVVFVATRLLNITSLPIFTDEAIYTRWAQIAKSDSNWRFISLTDGKNPSFIWADSIMMKLIDDPLLAGRLVSVFAGFLVCVGIYFLTREIFASKEKNSMRVISLIAVALTVLFPFLLVYDRLAIYESMTAAFFVWSLYFQILLVRRLRLDLAMILGFILGGSVLTKSSGFLSLYLTPVLLLLFNFSDKARKQKLIKFTVLVIVSAVIAYGMYSVQRLSPFFHIIAEKNTIFVHPIGEWLKLQPMDKVANFQRNFMGLWDWFMIYFTPPYALLAVVSFFISKRFLKEKILLVAWFVIPFLGLCVLGKTLYPRYILFMTLPLIPLVAYSIYELFSRYKNLALRVAFIVIIAILPLRMMYYVIFDFANAPIPRLDLEQFINGWPAGGGIGESVEFFNNESKKGPIYVATQGTFGLLPHAYETYFLNNSNITLKGYWPINETIPEEIAKEAETKPVYVVFYQDCLHCALPGVAPTTWPIEKIASYKKGIGNTTLTIYKVKTPDAKSK